MTSGTQLRKGMWSVNWRGVFRNSKRIKELEAREKVLQSEIQMLSRASLMTGEFYQSMSHDFKTPLTVISTSIHNSADLLDYGGCRR